eukprot:11333713-Alexandrium_andersonii.AAC.1
MPPAKAPPPLVKGGAATATCAGPGDLRVADLPSGKWQQGPLGDVASREEDAAAASPGPTLQA